MSINIHLCSQIVLLHTSGLVPPPRKVPLSPGGEIRDDKSRVEFGIGSASRSNRSDASDSLR